MSFLLGAWNWIKDNTSGPTTHNTRGAMANADELAQGKDIHSKEDSEANSEAESALNDSPSAASGYPEDFKEQNVIGRDIEPIDPNFHVMRPINLLAIKTHPDMAAADVIEMSGGKIGQEQAWELIEAVIDYGGGPSCGPLIDSNQYYNILQSVSPYTVNTRVALSLATGKSSYPSTPNTKLGNLAPYQTSLMDYMQNRQYKYECRLFNFYADNNKYFSGHFTLTGRIGMEFGKRVIWFDRRRRYAWEFYLTGVHHSFRYDGSGNGWTTTITVERGLPFTYVEASEMFTNQNTDQYWLRDNDYTDINGNLVSGAGKPIRGNFHKRFEMMWGHAEPFVGGFFGEQTLGSMLSQAQARENAYMTKFTGGGSLSDGGSTSSGSGGPDGTGSIKEKVPGAWKPQDVPADVKKYIHSPTDVGMKYNSSSGWSMTATPGQCVDFACSYFHKIWGTKQGQVMGDGRDMANSWHSAIPGSIESTKPRAGAIAGSTCADPNTGQNHTWIVEHVLANGDSICVECNWPGMSGADQGSPGAFTWNYCTWPKNMEGTKYTVPSSKYHLSWS